jgi:uncharacterized protein
MAAWSDDASLKTASQTSSRSKWRVLWRISRSVLIGFLLILLVMMLFEEKLIFFPAKYPAGRWDPVGLEFEDAEFSASDGVRLHGWYVPHPRPRAVVLISHGNGGNLSHRDDLLRALHRLGAASMIYDYRGYGRSEGTPNEKGVLLDGKAAAAWLAGRSSTSESQLVQFGESLGGAVAVHLAAQVGARGLILENTFSSLADVGAYHYPWLPVRLLMQSKFDSVRTISKYRGPVLQIHGDADTVIPIEIGRRLHAAANEPKEFIVAPGVDHNDPRSHAVYEAIDRFFDRLQPVE